MLSGGSVHSTKCLQKTKFPRLTVLSCWSHSAESQRTPRVVSGEEAASANCAPIRLRDHRLAPTTRRHRRRDLGGRRRRGARRGTSRQDQARPTRPRDRNTPRRRRQTARCGTHHGANTRWQRIWLLQLPIRERQSRQCVADTDASARGGFTVDFIRCAELKFSLRAHRSARNSLILMSGIWPSLDFSHGMGRIHRRFPDLSARFSRGGAKSVVGCRLHVRNRLGWRLILSAGDPTLRPNRGPGGRPVERHDLAPMPSSTCVLPPRPGGGQAPPAEADCP